MQPQTRRKLWSLVSVALRGGWDEKSTIIAEGLLGRATRCTDVLLVFSKSALQYGCK